MTVFSCVGLHRRCGLQTGIREQATSPTDSESRREWFLMPRRFEGAGRALGGFCLRLEVVSEAGPGSGNEEGMLFQQAE